MKRPIDSLQIHFLLRRLKREFPDARDAGLMEIILQADRESPEDEPFHAYTERVSNITQKRYAKADHSTGRDSLLNGIPHDPALIQTASAA